MLEMGAVVFLATMGGALSLEVTSPQDVVLPGEPIKLVMRWNARTTVRVLLADGQENVESLQFAVWRASGAPIGFYYERGVRSLLNVPSSGHDLGTGRTAVTNVYLVRGGYGEREKYRQGFIFPEPGDFSIVVRYREGGTVVAESKAVRFEVRAPSGDEAKVHAIIAKAPQLLRSEGTEAEKLLERYPESRYLQHLKVVRADRWRHALVNLVDPQSREPVTGLHGEALRLWRVEQSRVLAGKLLAEGDWGAFDEERISWAASFTEWSGDQSGAARLRAELRTRFPRSKAVHARAEREVP